MGVLKFMEKETSNLTQNIREMFRKRKRGKKKDYYNPDQPSYLLSLTVEPSLFEKIFSFLDHKSVASLELTCTLLRDAVIQNKVYRGMFRRVVGETFSEPYYEEELLVKMSCFYKNKLFQHFHRKRTDQMRQNYLKTSWHTPDCASCMMIETGEKASQPGLRCDSCGRFPRSIGG